MNDFIGSRIAFPFQLGDRNQIARASGDLAIRQSIYVIVYTIPGERVMRPDYGCMLHRLLFAPNDETTAGLAIYYVQRAIDRWEPRVIVLDIDAERHPEAPHQLDIHLRYRVKPTHQIDTLNFSFNLAWDVG